MHPRFGDSFLCDPAKTLDLPGGFRFHRGELVAPFSIVFETYGTLSPAKDNAVLVCHALSPGAHAAGRYSRDDAKPGWWDGMIGYDKGIDLANHFVVCVNFPGSPWGTTAPHSLNPSTGKAYGSTYPWMLVEDMVESQRLVADHLGVAKWKAVVGSSLGGMQALMWAATHPARVGALVCMAACAAVPVTGVAWHLIGRKLVESDAAFHRGDYYDSIGDEMLRGLQMARMVGHMTYLSPASMEAKFGRRRRGGTRQFEVDSYLEYQGQKFATQYDANSYIRGQAAMDEMDLEEQFGSFEAAFEKFRGKTLLVAFDTDWLFPVADIRRLHEGMRNAGVDATLLEIATPNGHDAFLLDYPLIIPPVRKLLA